MGSAELAGEQFDAAIIIESWRLWNEIGGEFQKAARVISHWTLDADIFALEGGPRKVVVVIAKGAAVAASAVEHIAGAGARQVVRLGTAGALSPELGNGRVVVHYAAARGEGVSGFYIPAGVPALADQTLTQRLARELSLNLEEPVPLSLVFTTDGRWCSSDEFKHDLLQVGVDTLDMETAGIFAVGMRKGLSAASVSVVSDLVPLPGQPKAERKATTHADFNQTCRRAKQVLAVLVKVLSE